LRIEYLNAIQQLQEASQTTRFRYDSSERSQRNRYVEYTLERYNQLRNTGIDPNAF